jgi:hypothetical protein
MKNNLLKISVFPVVLLSLFAFSNLAFASETTGTLTTGISATNGSTVNGVVIAPPTASPVAGSYTSAQSVGLTADGASNIHYTTDGTSPTCSSGTLYSSSISVSSTLTIKAISCYPQSKTSTVATYAYTINIPVVSSGGSGGGGGGGGGPIIQNTQTTLSAEAQKVDSNHDGKIDVLDFVTLMANWGKTGTGNVADFNGDGKVDILDFVLLMANWTR